MSVPHWCAPPKGVQAYLGRLLQSKVRGTGTITALLFKPRNVQVRLPPRKRAHAPQPRACRMRVAIAHPYGPKMQGAVSFICNGSTVV